MRDLHSFPTRRSSDLVPGQVVKVELEHEQGILVYEVEILTQQGVKYEVAVDVNSDRKSTRLNSSHVAISYAVFCLKKKDSLISFVVVNYDYRSYARRE